MKQYRITTLLPLAAGTVVGLTDAQAQRRRGRITDLGEGRYRLNELLQFKVGELIGIEGSLPKVHGDYVQDPSESPIAPPSEAQLDSGAATAPRGRKK